MTAWHVKQKWEQWRAEGGMNGATAPGIQIVKLQNSKFASYFLNAAHIYPPFLSDRFSSNV